MNEQENDKLRLENIRQYSILMAIIEFINLSAGDPESARAICGLIHIAYQSLLEKKNEKC